MSQPLRLLLVEDSETDAKLVHRELRRAGYEVESERVEDPESMRAALGRGGWDLIISDWSMPKFSGLAALELLKSTEQDIPFLIVSGTIGEEWAVEAMRGGARDYVLKDKLSRLGPAVARELAEAIERNRARVALRAEQDRAQRYLDTAGVILLALDMEGRITLVNRFACSAFGWTADELLGREFIEVCVPPRLRAKTREKLRDVQLGDDSTVVNEIVTKAGEERLIEWRTTFLRDDNQEIVGTFSSGSDITARLDAEAALRGERDRAQQYLDAAEVVMLSLDLDRRIQVINRKGCELLGWTEQELIGQDWAAMCLPERLRPGLSERFEGVLRGDIEIIENPILTKGGAERLIEWRNRVLRDDAGEVVGSFSSGTDITDRHEATVALRETEERMRFALENAAVGIWDMDYGTGLARMSEILEAHHGIPAGSFEGTFEAFAESIHPEDRAAVLSTIGDALKTGDDFSFVYRPIRPDGALRWLNNAGRIHLDPQGNPLRGVGISLDVTARRTLEDQLRQAQKMEAIGSLAGGIAHDFNNLLSVILSYSTILANDLKPQDPMRADLNEIRLAGERAAELTEQLLTFSRKQVVQARPIDLNQVIGRLEKMLRRLVPESIELTIELEASLSLVFADIGQMEQVLTNLVVNARDALPDGGKIMIESENVILDAHYAARHVEIKPGPHVMLAVTDNGTGMDKGTLTQIFDPFFTTKEEGKGTGLGLATVFGIIKQSGGAIGVYSEPGHGSTFKIYLPSMADGSLTRGEESLAESVSLEGSETVLLVEDDKSVRQLARTILQGYGYNVLEAAGGGDALLICETHPSTIHLMLSDIVMPKMSGPQLAARLKILRPSMRVLFMSGYTGKAVVHNGVLDSDVAFLQKPITPEKLGAKVREVLDAPDVVT